MKCKEQKVDIGHISLALKVWGEPSSLTPVLLLHGWLDNASSFDAVLSHMPDDRQYFALDLPGHGYSDHKAEGQLYHFLDGIVDVRRVIEVLAFERVILVGHSLGAAISSVFTSAYPELVEKLCLIEAVGPIASEEKDMARQLKSSVDQQLKGSGNNLTRYQTVEEMINVRQRGIGGLGYQASKTLVQRSYKKLDDCFVWSTDSRLRIPSPMRLSESQVEALLTKVSVPVFIVLAEKSLIPENIIRQRLGYFQSPHVSYMPGGHHLHMEESSALVAKELNLFLKGKL